MIRVIYLSFLIFILCGTIPFNSNAGNYSRNSFINNKLNTNPILINYSQGNSISEFIKGYIDFNLSANTQFLILSNNICSKNRFLKDENGQEYDYLNFLKDNLNGMYNLRINCIVSENGSKFKYDAEITNKSANKIILKLKKEVYPEDLINIVDSSIYLIKKYMNVSGNSSVYLKNDAEISLREQDDIGNLILSSFSNISILELDSIAKKLIKNYTGNSKSIVAEYFAGRVFSCTNNIDESIKIYKHLIDMYPKHVGSYYKLIRLYRYNNEFEDAVKYCNIAKKNKVENLPIQIEKGLNLTLLGRNKDAEEIFNRISQINSDIASEVKLELVGIYLKNQKYYKALDQLNDIENSIGSSAYLDAKKGDIFLLLNNKKNALKYYKKSLLKNENNLYVHKKIAEIYYDLNIIDSSFNEYSIVNSLDSSDIEVNYRLAILNIKKGLTGTASEIISNTREKNEPTSELSIELGDAYAKIHQTETAEFFYNKALTTVGNKKDVLVKLCRMYSLNEMDSSSAECLLKLSNFCTKDYEKKMIKAAKIFSSLGLKNKEHDVYIRMIKRGSPNVEIRTKLATILFDEMKFDSVVNVLKPVDKDAIKNTKILLEYATSLSRVGEYKRANNILNKLMRIMPDDLKTLKISAESFEKSNELKKSIKIYKHILELSSLMEKKQIAFKIGILNKKIGNIKLAIKRFEENIKLWPLDIRNYNELENIYIKQGNIEKVIEVLDMESNVFSKSPKVYKKLAEAYIGNNEFDSAVVKYKKYLSLVKNDSTSWCRLGYAYYKGKKFSKAVPVFLKALNFMPDNFNCSYWLGRSYKNIAEQNKKKKTLNLAIKYLENAIKISYADSNVFSYLADCYRIANDRPGIVNLVERFALLHPSDFMLSLDIVDIFIKKGYISEVIKGLENASRKLPENIKLHMELADLYAKVNDKKNQLSHLEFALLYSPKNPKILLKLGIYYFNEKKYDTAENYFEKTVKINPNISLAQYNYAKVLKILKNYEDALEHFYKALNLEKNNLDYFWEYSKLAYYLGKIKDALNVAESTLKSHPGNSKLTGWLGYLLFKQEHINKGLGLLKKSVSMDTSCTECWGWYGNTFFTIKNYTNAIDAYNKAIIDTSAYNDSLLVKKGLAFEFLGKYSNAQKIFETVLKRRKERGDVLYFLIRNLLQQNLPDSASIVLKKFKNKHENGWYDLSKGTILEYDNLLDDAFAYYESASKKMPDNSLPFIACARVKANQKDIASATKFMGEAISLEPNNMDYLLLLGRLYKSVNDKISEEALYRELIRRKPDIDMGYYSLAKLLFEKRDFKEAVKIIKKGIKISPQSPSLYELTGDIYRSMNKFNDAVRAYKMAIKFNSKNKKILWRNIGMIYYESLKNDKEASFALNEFINAGGYDRLVNRILKSISKK